MIYVLVRTVGIVACFFTSWILGSVALLPLLLVKSSSAKNSIGIKFASSIPRCVAEVLSTVIALYGIWALPLVSRNTATIALVVAILLIALEFGLIEVRARSRA